MRSILYVIAIFAIGLVGCSEAPLSAEPEEVLGSNVAPEALIDAEVLSVAVNGRTLAPQELALQLFAQPRTSYSSEAGGAPVEVVDPGEAFAWTATLPGLGYVTMSIDGLIPQEADYQHGALWSAIPVGERFDMDYSPASCRIWQYTSVQSNTSDNPGSMRIEFSDAKRISGTFTAKLKLYQVAYFVFDSSTCPDGLDSTRPSLEEITLTGSFDIERPTELPLLRKLDDGRTVTETWRAP